MPTVPMLLTFAVAATLLIVVPGPNLIYIVPRGIDQGRRAAVVSALGVETGMLIHVGAAVLGLSAVLASSELLFNVVRYAGAAYLIWLGVASIRSRPADLTDPAGGRKLSPARLYTQGIVINVLNPKVGLFFLAFLPQFLDPSRGDTSVQILVFGAIFSGIATISDLLYAMASGAIGSWLRRRSSVARLRGKFSGVVYIALGAVAALTGSSSARHG